MQSCLPTPLKAILDFFVPLRELESKTFFGIDLHPFVCVATASADNIYEDWT